MEEENQSNKSSRISCSSGMSDVVLGCVMPYIHDPRDRDAVSLVCRRWYELDALTRKHITIALCYTTSPDRLRRRFKHLESLKLKGKPRAAMFNLIPEDWGGFVTPWVNEIAESFNCLKSLHFRRMIVKDSDLELLAKSRGRVLQVLKIEKCSGFSTDGLLHVGRLCSFKILLDNLLPFCPSFNVFMCHMDLNTVRFEDLELIAKNCRNLVSVKISDCEILDLVGFFNAAAALEEFCGGSFNDVPDSVPFCIPAQKLDLLYALLDTEDHCLLIQKCCNLEVLETRNVIGDRGLEVLASSCKRLKRLRIERGADEQGMEDEEGVFTERINCFGSGLSRTGIHAVYVPQTSQMLL
ncbi:hypothetical protein GH714_012465 [Hevea brasiliensis]|uniref:COI1 F-box domain-containing protein n=1 Tax=Hevea brasiliensis TaxID=3981 RepID=A0A6A6N0Z9_HEVBR|nr:hypothetical protein GH714_012465 [Hevea brasiliensis]